MPGTPRHQMRAAPLGPLARVFTIFTTIASIVTISTISLDLTSGTALAQSAPPGFSIENAFPGATFDLPSLLVFMPDGRKLVVEKDGRIWVVTPDGVKLTTPFVDLSAKVLSNDDRGLHGVVLDPDFYSNRWVYLLYTVDPDSDGVDDNIGAFGRLERYKTDLNNPNVLDLTTRQILIGSSWPLGWPEPPRHRHHMPGTLRFAPDKTLLVGAGDAADAGFVADAGGTDPLDSYGPGRTDPSEDIGAFRSRTLNSLDGKILRVDKETGRGLPSNPFWDGDPNSHRSRVWAYGLRNPFRFALRPGTGSTDPAAGRPGVIYMGDVGWNTTEEMSIARQGGLNFGWPCFEGPYSQPDYQAVTTTYYPNPNVICSAGLNTENPQPDTGPVLWWDHHNGANSNPAGWTGNCAIGGTFYTGNSYPSAYRGAYFIADYGQGWIRRVQVDGNDNVVSTSTFIEGAGGVCDVEPDPASGDLYYIDINSSTIHRVRYASGNLPPVVHASVTPTSGYAPLTVTVTASASTDPDGDPLTFSWNFGDGGTAHSPDTTYTYQHPGTYLATVSVNDGHSGSSLATFTVVAQQVPNPGTIISPLDNSFFHQNQPLLLQASPVDTSQGPATYRWDIDLFHNDQVQPSFQTYFGQSTSFDPSTPNDGDAYHLGIRLTVTQGAQAILDTVRVWPRLNLTPVSISFDPAAPIYGTPFQVTGRIRSVGEVGSSASTFQVREGPTVLAGGALVPILNGDSLDVAATVNGLSVGDHTLSFVVDPANDLFETEEADNSISADVTIGGLAAAYGFDEGSGTTTSDASGSGITGTIQGATWTTAGKYGNALSFGGQNTYVDLGNPDVLDLTGDMTLSAWVNAAANPPNDGQIIAKSDSNTGWQLKTSPDTGPETFAIAVTGAPGSYAGRYSTTVRALNTWYHVAGVYSAATRKLDIYVNGVLDNGQLIGTIPGSQFNSEQNATIGQRFGGYNFKGVIDEVRIYNRALSAAEIQADMNTPISDLSGVGGPVHPTTPPAAYELSEVRPNPFSRSTSIRYAIPRDGLVRLQVFNVAGQLVATLVDGMQPAGAHEVSFEPKQLASGLYVCRLQAGGFAVSRKLFYLR